MLNFEEEEEGEDRGEGGSEIDKGFEEVIEQFMGHGQELWEEEVKGEKELLDIDRPEEHYDHSIPPDPPFLPNDVTRDFLLVLHKYPTISNKAANAILSFIRTHHNSLPDLPPRIETAKKMITNAADLVGDVKWNTERVPFMGNYYIMNYRNILDCFDEIVREHKESVVWDSDVVYDEQVRSFVIFDYEGSHLNNVFTGLAEFRRSMDRNVV